jgi:hypothetical protein
VANPAGPVSGTTDGGGHFFVSFTSATAGQVIGNASTTFSVGGVSLTRATGDSHTGDGGPATKTFVDANIQITPATATNPVGSPHTFTVTVQQNAGQGAGFVPAPNGTVVHLSITSGAATFVATGTQTQDVTISNGLGAFTVVINSTVAGDNTIHASTTFSVGGVSLTRATGDTHVGDSPDAHKTYTANFHGLTPGFWKNNAINWGAVAWKVYTPSTPLASVFLHTDEYSSLKGINLLQALQLNGGGVNALMRQAVAALLNSSNPLVNYPISTADVISKTNAALASHDPTQLSALQALFEADNSLEGGIDQHGNPIG